MGENTSIHSISGNRSRFLNRFRFSLGRLHGLAYCRKQLENPLWHANPTMVNEGVISIG